MMISQHDRPVFRFKRILTCYNRSMKRSRIYTSISVLMTVVMMTAALSGCVFKNIKNITETTEVPTDEWATGLMADAARKMYDDGDVYPGELEGGELFLFEGEYAECDIVYSSDGVREKYTGSQPDIDGKVVWGHLSPAGQVQLFAGSIYKDLDDEAVAESIDEAKYLIVYCGFVSRVDKGFYDGGIDRVLMTTLVLVIDVQERSVVHIENVGTDCPSGYMSDRSRGFALDDAALEYMNGLCGGSSETE